MKVKTRNILITNYLSKFLHPVSFSQKNTISHTGRWFIKFNNNIDIEGFCNNLWHKKNCIQLSFILKLIAVMELNIALRI